MVTGGTVIIVRTTGTVIIARITGTAIIARTTSTAISRPHGYYGGGPGISLSFGSGGYRGW